MKHLMQLNAKKCAYLNTYCSKPISCFRRLLVTSSDTSDFSFKLKNRLLSDRPRDVSTYANLHKNYYSLKRQSFNIGNRHSIRLNTEEEAVSKDNDEPDSFRDECLKQEQFLTARLQIEVNNVNDMTHEKWDELKKLVLKMYGTISQENIDAIIMSKCGELKSLLLGKSYFQYLKATNSLINRATYGNYLRLFHQCGSVCSSDDLNDILVVYKELSEVYPLLDSYTAEKAILALCLTENWKEYEKLFIAIKQFYNPTVNTYRVVIQTAFDHHEFELGWKLMEEMQYLGLNVPDVVFEYWLQKVSFRNIEEDLTQVLNFFNFFNVKPSDAVCKSIGNAFIKYNNEGYVTHTKITRSGVCRSCSSCLEPCHIPQEDFDQLRKAFLNPVVIGKDIFLKTKPKEFKDFLDFLKDSAPFDIVIDGLNVAFYGSAKTVNDNTQRLKSVVKFFVNLKKKVLVLGRKHMASWNTPHMEYVKQNAHLFYTEDLSQDDPFMLYAALYSGLGTCFISRDMMRGHKFLLADKKLQITFQKWQSLYQCFPLHIDRDENVFFVEPVKFLQNIQQNAKGDWHVPYTPVMEDLTNKDRVDHLHRHWLCMQKKAGRKIASTFRSSPSAGPETFSSVRDIDKHSNKPSERPPRKSSNRIALKELLKMD